LYGTDWPAGTSWFQSAPGGEAGGNKDITIAGCCLSMFQSAPGGEAGGNPRLLISPSRSRCFNPPPAVRPGETIGTTGRVLIDQVSIRPRR